MSEYTPTTWEIQHAYILLRQVAPMPDSTPALEFDRWFTQHNSEVAAGAAKAERERNVQKLNKFIKELYSYADSLEEKGGDSSWAIKKASAMYSAITVIEEDNYEMSDYTPKNPQAPKTPKTSTVKEGWGRGHPFALVTEPEERSAEFDRWLAQHDEEIVARTILALSKPLHVELTAALDNKSTGYVFEDYPGGGWRTWISDAKQLIEGGNE